MKFYYITIGLLINFLYLSFVFSSSELEHYKKACNKGDFKSCFELGFIYENGKGVKKDINKAKELYEKACKAKLDKACIGLATIYIKIGNKEKGINLLRNVCNNGNAFSCELLGEIYALSKPPSLKESVKWHRKALELYKRDCENGDSLACDSVAFYYKSGVYVKKDIDKAIEFYRKACILDDYSDCSEYINLIRKYKYKNFPTPFGLILGVSTQKQFESKILDKVILRNFKNYRKIVKHGYKIIKQDIINPNVYGYIFEKGINLQNLNRAIFWFYKGTLMEIKYVFNEDMEKNTFYLYLDKLTAKYGEPKVYRKPYLGDGLAIWQVGNVRVELSVPWVSRYTYLVYKDINLSKKAEEDDKKYYENYIKKKIKNEEGL